MSLKSDDASILADAQWLPTHLSADRRQLQFGWVPREAHPNLPFLADQYLRDIAPPTAWVSLEKVSAAEQSPAPAHFIFHSAFCCSTLLTRALDLPGVAMGLKEPQILNELAAAMRSRTLAPELLGRISSLLARPFGRGESIIVKPSNEANVIAESLLRQDSRTKAILLYAPLPRFLRSVARKGMWGRIWSRRLFALLRGDKSPEFGFSQAELFGQTDLQIAATAWLMHHYHFTALIAEFPGQVRILDSETLLADREDCLQKIGDYFGLSLDRGGWREVAHSRVFQEHSKEIGSRYDEERAQKAEIFPAFIQEEIDMICSWANSLAAHIGLSMDPPASQRVAS